MWKKIDKQFIILTIWYLILITLSAALLTIALIYPEDNTIGYIIPIILISIALLASIFAECYNIYCLISNIKFIRKNSKGK